MRYKKVVNVVHRQEVATLYSDLSGLYILCSRNQRSYRCHPAFSTPSAKACVA